MHVQHPRADADPAVVDALVNQAPIEPGSPRARARRTVAEEVERQIQRAIERAERRSRRVPRHVRQGTSWVNGQRRRMAHELARALRSLGAGVELSRAIATRACERFPRNGIVLPAGTDRPERPRDRGTNPRAKGTNPRARGDSPRQKRAKLAAAELRDVQPTVITGPAIAAAPAPADVARAIPRAAAGDWDATKQAIFNELEPHEKLAARRRARDEQKRLDSMRPKP